MKRSIPLIRLFIINLGIIGLIKTGYSSEALNDFLPWQQLPLDIKKKVISYIDFPDDYTHLALTNKQNKSLVIDQFREEFPNITPHALKIFLNLYASAHISPPSLAHLEQFKVKPFMVQEFSLLYGNEANFPKISYLKKANKYIKEIKERNTNSSRIPAIDLSVEQLNITRAIYSKIRSMYLSSLQETWNAQYRSEEEEIIYQIAKLSINYAKIDPSPLSLHYKNQSEFLMLRLNATKNLEIKVKTLFYQPLLFINSIKTKEILEEYSLVKPSLLLKIAKKMEAGLNSNGIEEIFNSNASVTQDIFAFYQKASDLKLMEATYELGRLYFTGQAEGISLQDIEKAVELWSYGAKWGNANCQAILGTLYIIGLADKNLSYSESRKKAFYWWNYAAAQGHGIARYQKEYIEAYDFPEQDDNYIILNQYIDKLVDEYAPIYYFTPKKKKYGTAIPKFRGSILPFKKSNPIFRSDADLFSGMQEEYFKTPRIVKAYIQELKNTRPQLALTLYQEALHRNDVHALRSIQRIITSRKLTYDFELSSCKLSKVFFLELISVLSENIFSNSLANTNQKEKYGITSLALNNCSIGELSFTVVDKNTNNNNTVTGISLDNNNIHDSCLFMLEFINGFKALKILNLANNNLSDKNISCIMSNSNLQELDLSNNGLGDKSAMILALMPNLKVLNLNNNKVGDRGAAALLEKKFQSLGLQNNNISLQLLQKIMKKFSNPSPLRINKSLRIGFILENEFLNNDN